MPDPVEPNRTLESPADASAASDRDETASASSRGSGAPKFAPPIAAGEVGTLGPYRVLRELGKGGMGAVYLAVDTRLGRKLALKVMLPELAADRDAKERFLREAKAAALVAHDHVVTVYEADERGGVPYIAMQFLQGYPLDEYLKHKGAPSVAQSVKIAYEAALGLAAAHELGLVHRDVKPANLWLEASNGRVKVLDFGLAKPVGADAELTKSGAVMGTPAYMSPEQARGLKVDARADLFSLGAVLYRLCAGRGPFAGGHVMAVLAAVLADEPAPVRGLNPGVPEPLAQLIHQLLAKRPEHRPQTAAEVAQRLRAILEHPVAAGPSPDVSMSQPMLVAHPVVVPLQVTARPEDVFASLVADDDESDESDETQAEAAPAAVKRDGNGLLIAAGAAVLLAVVAAAVAVSQTGKKPSSVSADPPSVPNVSPNLPRVPQVPNPGQKEPQPPTADLPSVRRPPKPWVPPAPVPVGASPFDNLDPGAIPKEERFGWQPKELVAVAGTHSPRTWTGLQGEHARARFAVSADGKQVVAAGSPHVPLQVWDVATRSVVAELAVPQDHFTYAPVFTPDSGALITQIFHPGRWYFRWSLAEPHRRPVEWAKGLPIDQVVTGMWLSPNGGRIVLQSGEVTIWDVIVEPPKELFRAPSNAWGDVGVSRDCTRIASHSAAAKGVVVYDVTAAGPKERLVAEADVPLCALSPDGTKLVTWREGQLLFWDLAADKPSPVAFMTRALNAGRTMAFSPDGARLVTQDADHCLRLWDTSGPRPKPVWAAPLRLRGSDPTRPTRAAFAGADGRTLVALTGWGFVYFIDASGTEPKVLNPLTASEPIGPELTVVGATGRVALGRADDDRRQVWDFARARPEPTDQVLPRGTFAHTSGFHRMAVWEGGRLNVLTDNAPTGSLPGMDTLGAFSTNGRRYWGLAQYDRERGWWCTGWDLSGPSPQELGSVPVVVEHGTVVKLVRNDSVLVTVSKGKPQFWDLTAVKPALLSELPHVTGVDVGIFPDGERVLCRGPHAIPQLWWLSDRGWEKVWEDPKVGWPIWAVHPSGRFFAQYAGGEITVRRAEDGGVKHTIPFGKVVPQKIEFAPDGRHLFVVNGFNTVYVLRIPGLDADRAAAEWARSVGAAVEVSDAAGAHSVLQLHFTDRPVADADLTQLAGLSALGNLSLAGTKVTDAGLPGLQGLPSLGALDLSRTAVTDAGLKHLGAMRSLGVLILNSTPVTDAGLEQLAGLGRLSSLQLLGTKVTADGVAKLQKALPGCKIAWDGPKQP